MAVTQSANLNLKIEDDDEVVSILKTAENFETIDAAIGADRTRLSALESPTVTQAQELSNIDTSDNTATKWGKVKKAIASIISHIGAGAGAHAAATGATNGFMSAADKEKLDGIQEGATASAARDLVVNDVTSSVNISAYSLGGSGYSKQISSTNLTKTGEWLIFFKFSIDTDNVSGISTRFNLVLEDGNYNNFHQENFVATSSSKTHCEVFTIIKKISISTNTTTGKRIIARIDNSDGSNGIKVLNSCMVAISLS